MQVHEGMTAESDEDAQRLLFFRRGAAISLQARRTVDPSGEGEEAETGTLPGEVESTTGLDYDNSRVLHLLKRKSYLLYRLQKMKCKQAKEHNARKASHVSLTALARYSSRPELRGSNLQLMPRPPCAGESSVGVFGAVASSSVGEATGEAPEPSMAREGSKTSQSPSNKGSQPTLELDEEEDRCAFELRYGI